MHISDFLSSDYGRWIRHNRRFSRRLRLEVEDIEPQTKTVMSPNNQRAFQAAISRQIAEAKRRPFRGPVALQLLMTTTTRNPPHTHTIAKNLLDLLGASPISNGKSVLYKDDSQVQGLSVVCAHGGERPKISIEAMAFGDFFEDLDLAMYGRGGWEESYKIRKRLRDDGDYIFDPAELAELEAIELTNDKELKKARLHRLRQKKFLEGAEITVSQLGVLYGALGMHYDVGQLARHTLFESTEDWFKASDYRILLTELPQNSGTSATYRMHVQESIANLQARYKEILAPLKYPLGLEVIVKPPPTDRTNAMHDLDNILRDYIIPRVVEILQPPSDTVWSMSEPFQETYRPSVHFPWQFETRQVSRSPRISITKYAAWRLNRHPQDSRPGFVSVSLVPNVNETDGFFRRLDTTLIDWESSIDR